MFVSHSPQEFISNCPTLCAHQILAMVLISLSAKSLPGHQANSSTQPLEPQPRERVMHCLLSFLCGGVCIHINSEDSGDAEVSLSNSKGTCGLLRPLNSKRVERVYREHRMSYTDVSVY